MNNSEITVFIPTYGRLDRLKNAVHSVLAQGDFVRLHVLDNASGDGTAAWLSQLQKSDRRVQLTLRNINIGAAKNFEDGFASAKTAYVVPLADDDELAPGFLEKSLKIMKMQPELGAVIFVTESRLNGIVAGRSPWKVSRGRHDPKDHLPLWGEFGHYVSWSSILWETETIRKHVTSGEFERFGPASDAWIEFLVFAEKPVFLQDEVGSIFNEHESQCSKTVSPGVIIQIGQMIESINKHIEENDILNSDERRLFMNNYCRILSEYVLGLCQGTTIPPEKDEIDDWWNAYLDNFFPHVGLACFPLLPLFEQYQERRFKIMELTPKAIEYDRIRNSPFWIIAGPLMRIDKILRSMLPKSLKAYLQKVKLNLGLQY